VDEAQVAKDLADLDSFCDRLDELGPRLSDKERVILDRLFFRAMGPLDRLRVRRARGALDADEQAMLDELAAEERGV
jgi:hypothetical protein